MCSCPHLTPHAHWNIEVGMQPYLAWFKPLQSHDEHEKCGAIRFGSTIAIPSLGHHGTQLSMVGSVGIGAGCRHAVKTRVIFGGVEVFHLKPVLRDTDLTEKKKIAVSRLDLT